MFDSLNMLYFLYQFSYINYLVHSNLQKFICNSSAQIFFSLSEGIADERKIERYIQGKTYEADADYIGRPNNNKMSKLKQKCRA